MSGGISVAELGGIMKTLRFHILAVTAAIFGLSNVAHAATVTVGWDASPLPAVTGYQVCLSSTPSCVAGGVVTIGNRTNWTFQNLADNRLYYFFVRALTPTEASPWAQLPYTTPSPSSAGSEETRSDFNGDLLADVLWQNNATNQLATWHMNGSTLLTSRLISEAGSPGWKVVGSGDLNHDGKPDLVWMHQTAGDLAYWLMDGAVIYGAGGFSFPRVDPSWNLISVRDMDRDGSPDFVWHNRVDGQLAVWYMDGPAVRQAVMMNPGQVADTNWKPRATADFTGDGWPDLLWRNEATGELVLWEMNGRTFVAARALNPGSADPAWKIGAVEDANGDGWPDIVWHNETTGQIALWTMVGGNLRSVSAFNVALSDSNWKMVGPR